MRVVPPSHASGEEHRRVLSTTLNVVMDGHTNGAGSVTLATSSTTTVVTDRRVGVDSVIVFMPKTATAAAALTGLYVSSRGDGTFTITHADSEDGDRDYEYGLIGTGRGT